MSARVFILQTRGVLKKSKLKTVKVINNAINNENKNIYCSLNILLVIGFITFSNIKNTDQRMFLRIILIYTHCVIVSSKQPDIGMLNFISNFVVNVIVQKNIKYYFRILMATYILYNEIKLEVICSGICKLYLASTSILRSFMQEMDV